MGAGYMHGCRVYGCNGCTICLDNPDERKILLEINIHYRLIHLKFRVCIDLFVFDFKLQ